MKGQQASTTPVTACRWSGWLGCSSHGPWKSTRGVFHVGLEGVGGVGRPQTIPSRDLYSGAWRPCCGAPPRTSVVRVAPSGPARPSPGSERGNTGGPALRRIPCPAGSGTARASPSPSAIRAQLPARAPSRSWPGDGTAASPSPWRVADEHTVDLRCRCGTLQRPARNSRRRSSMAMCTPSSRRSRDFSTGGCARLTAGSLGDPRVRGPARRA